MKRKTNWTNEDIGGVVCRAVLRGCTLLEALAFAASVAGIPAREAARRMVPGMRRARASYRRQGIRPMRTSVEWNKGWYIGLFPDFQQESKDRT